MNPLSNFILIGMAASGKSTIGRQLAASLGWAFVDTDHLLEAWWGAPLQHITDSLGLQNFLQAEAEQILRTSLQRCVIATGGSVIYNERAMQHLITLGHIIYLRTSFTSITKRLRNPGSRGLAIGPGQTLRDLYEERTPLYERYAQTTILTDGRSLDAICTELIHILTQSDHLL
ncbi:MAG: shikimate kinase [Desulfovibrionales bacterium]|nr:shikimate kinase [Desulfovibrionales bacterium]